MRVQKIILAYPDVFQIDPSTVYSEFEALQRIASMDCKGNLLQIQDFKVRQSHLAVCNLFELGFRNLAVEISIDLIPEAEASYNYKVAIDLCNRLIEFFYQSGDLNAVHFYKTLYDKFFENISQKHDAMLLYGQVIINQNKVPSQNENEIKSLLEAIKQNLSIGTLSYHYFYFKLKSFILKGNDLEQHFLQAISYYENLYLRHESLTNHFQIKLVQHYLNRNELEKADKHLQKFEKGSLPWFKIYLIYTKALLKNKDILSNDICIFFMTHTNYTTLPNELKESWKLVYKASVRLLLDTSH